MNSTANPYPKEEILPGHQYHAVTYGADKNGNRWTEAHTGWVGFHPDDNRIELRTLSTIYPDRVADYWIEFGQPFLHVHDARSLARWIISGGHALLTSELTKRSLPWLLEPSECVMEGNLGFTSLTKVPKTAFQHAPTPKLRMKVLKRDLYRCLICGRRPADNVDIQLNIHHVRPFAQLGLTTEKNLITICHTCHAGLEPHYEMRLYDLIDPMLTIKGHELKKKMYEQYAEAVTNYRMAVQRDLAKLKAAKSGS